MDGNKLLRDLKALDTPGDTSRYCYKAYGEGYVTGVHDAFSGLFGTSLAIPERIEMGQIKDIVKKYLEDHPEKRHEPASGLILSALKKAFPPKQDNQ